MPYEIRPWHHISDTEVEQCDPAQADGWGVYDRADEPDKHGDQLAFWVVDFDTLELAEEYVRSKEKS